MGKKSGKGFLYQIKKLFRPLQMKFFRCPLVGEIDGKYKVKTAGINNKQYGKSRGVPFAMEFKINNNDAIPENIGKIVKNTFFADAPDFIFNVCFSCGDGGIFKKGVYTDPRSHWFNVFFGYYEIDVPKNSWNRPFGYNLQGSERSVNFLDLVKIGKSDWNYFSNYLYGVPASIIKQYNDVNSPDITSSYRGTIDIKNKKWDIAEVDNFEVVTAYTAENEEHRYEEKGIWSNLWQMSYGDPNPRKEYPVSFMPAKMKARFYMSFREVKHDTDLNKSAYKTFIFGGTINNSISIDKEKNEKFLDAQMEAVKKVITKNYAHLGF